MRYCAFFMRKGFWNTFPIIFGSLVILHWIIVSGNFDYDKNSRLAPGLNSLPHKSRHNKHTFHFEKARSHQSRKRQRTAESDVRWRSLCHGVYIYSAVIYPPLKQPALTLIAPNRNYLVGSKCQVQYAHDVEQKTDVYVMPLPATGDRYSHRGVVAICNTSNSGVPLRISISIKNCTTSPILKVFHSEEKQRDEIMACIKPFNYRYSHADRLREFIELSNMYGVKGFTFYNRTMSKNVSSLLHKYSALNSDRVFVQVRPWNLPLDTQKYKHFNSLNISNPYEGAVSIHDFGQLVCMMDCFMRNADTFKYILFIDVDEIIIPHKVPRYQDVFRMFPQGCVYVFQNTFFKLEFENDEINSLDPDVKRLKPLTLLKTRREQLIFRHGERSKYIVESKYLAIPGVHAPYRMLCNRVAAVPSDIALLHHYRWWDDPSLKHTVIDRRIMRDKDAILNRLLKAEQEGLSW